MRSFITTIAGVALACSPLEDPDDINVRVVDPAGNPAAGADVWVMLGNNTKLHLPTDANGRFGISQSLIESWWNERTYPHLTVRDREGRLGSQFRTPWAGNATMDVIKLDAVSEVTGRVVDDAGKPIAGARVSARGFSIPRAGLRAPESIPLPVELKPSYAAETDATGSFVVRGVPKKARLTADIDASGFARFMMDWDTRTELKLALPKAAKLIGKVTGGTNGDLAGQSFTLQSLDTPAPHERRSALVTWHQQSADVATDGTLRFDGIPPGKFVLSSASRSIGPVYVDRQTIEITAGAESVNVEMPIKTSRKLRGRVVAAAGNGVAGAKVMLCRFGANPFGQRGISRTDSEQVTDAGGEFEGYVIPDSEVGAQLMELPKGYAVMGAGQSVATGDRDAPLAPIQVEKAEPTIVRVVDEEGKPVRAATVAVTGAGAALVAVPKPTNANGETHLHFRDRGEISIVTAVTKEAASESITFEPSEIKEPIELRVSPKTACFLRGRAVDGKGRPIEGARVEFMRGLLYRSKRSPQTAGSGGTFAVLRTDDDGRFTLGPLPPGAEYEAHVAAENHRPASTAKITAAKSLVHDFGTIVMARVDGAVRGRVVDSAGRPIAGARISNSGDGPELVRTASDADGKFELSGLSAGEVVVTASHESFRPVFRQANSEKGEALAIILHRRDEMTAAAPPQSLDEKAMHAAAKTVLEKVWEWPDARKSPIDRKMVALMARVDPEKAREWSGKTATAPKPSLDKLVAEDVDEALAALSEMDPAVACRELKRLATKLLDADPAKASRLTEELTVRARALEPRSRSVSVIDAGVLLIKLGRTDAGRKIIEETAAHIDKLPKEGFEGYLRGHTAAGLALFDLPRAKQLLESTPEKFDRHRYMGICASTVAASNPKAAAELLGMIEKRERGRYAALAAYHMALSDTESAIGIAEEHGGGDSYTALGLAWIALRIAPQDKAAAHRLIDRAFRAIHERPEKAVAYTSFGGFSETAAHVALVAYAVDYPHRGDLAAHVFAERPSDNLLSGIRAADAHVGCAALLAPVDRAAARLFLDIADGRGDTIGVGNGNIRREREYLIAWALVDPARATPLLIADIDRLKAAGHGLYEHSGLIEALEIMTLAPADRLRQISRRFGESWPTGEYE